jgi:hypothetical protein
MTSWTRHPGAVLLLAGVAALLAPTAARAQAAGPIEDLFLPLEVYPNGKVKTQVSAAKATVPDRGGDIEATNVRFVFFGQDGVTQATVVSDRCIINKDTREAQSDAPIRIEKSGVLITGTGFIWNAATQKVSILSNVQVVLQRALLPELKRGLSDPEGKRAAGP